MTSLGDEDIIDPWSDEPAWEQSDLEDDDNDDMERDAHAYAARHTLILIDTHPSMFEPCIYIKSSDDSDIHEDKSDIINNDSSFLTTPFDASLMAVERLLHHKVYTVATSKQGKRDGVGVILFGTPPSCINKNIEKDDENSDGGNSDDDVDTNDDEEEEKDANDSLKVLIKLTPPGVDQIKTIRSCLLSQFYQSNRFPKWTSRIDGSNDGVHRINDQSQTNELIRNMKGWKSKNSKRERDLYVELFGRKKQVLTTKNTINNKNIKDDEDGMTDKEVRKDEEEECTVSSLKVALYEATRTFVNAKCVKKAPSTAPIEKTDAKTIWIFTNQDNPIPPNLSFENERDLLLTAVNDVYDNGLDIYLWPLPNKMRKSKFDKSIFYDDIISHHEDSDGESDDELESNAKYSLEEESPIQIHNGNEGEDGVVNIDLEQLLETIGRMWKKLRKSQSIPLLLPDWNIGQQAKVSPYKEDEVVMDTDATNEKNVYPGIMLDLFQTVRKRGKPNAVTIDSRTKKQTNTITQIYSKDTGEIVSQERIRSYTEFGGEHVLISKDEVTDLKKRCNGNPNQASLILLGFKPMPTTYEAMNTFTFVDKSIFAYPNDNLVKGSKKAFASLHKSMLRKNVMGIGELLLKVTAVSRLVAIVPQVEDRRIEDEYDDEEIYKQLAPPGFLLIPLAFKDDMRDMRGKSDFQPTKDMVDAAIELIRHQSIEESIEIGQSFENPALKMFWNYIESIALETSLDEDCSDGDDTTMNTEGILDIAGEKIHAFAKTIPEDIISVEANLRKKRERITDETVIDWVQEYNMDSFHELRKDVLKAYLQSYGLSVSGRKNEIIDRIKSHMKDNNIV